MAKKHGTQERKYTNTPYTDHLVEVAEIVRPFDGDGLYLVETDLCHDLYEDTDCTRNELGSILRDLRYSELGICAIQNAVTQLTDVFTPSDYPSMNRANRKKSEAIRLSKALPAFQIQTVKCADIISNAMSICVQDPKFWPIYKTECNFKLKLFQKAQPELLERVSWLLF